MKRGFTLLELIIVIIIIGVLATLGIMQYGSMVEKARGAEARSILGQIRTLAAAYRLEHGNTLVGFSNAGAGIGNAAATPGLIPNPCAVTHYFSYNISAVAANGFTAVATRCLAGGKTPQGSGVGGSLQLATDFVLGTDVWTGIGGY
jgi:prepilin-type N-terminal cleavage/methylation domain-containing protein